MILYITLLLIFICRKFSITLPFLDLAESPLPRAETPEITGCMVKDKDDADAKRFIRESTLNTITTLIPSDQDTKRPIIKPDKSDVSSSSSVTNNEERTSKEGGDIDRMLMPPPSSASSVTANGLEVDLIGKQKSLLRTIQFEDLEKLK